MPVWPMPSGGGLEYCVAYMTATQDIANNDQESLDFDASNGESWWNQGGDGVTVIRPSPAAGTYLAVANIKVTGPTAGTVQLQPIADSAVTVLDPGQILAGVSSLSGYSSAPMSATGVFVVSGTNYFRLLVTNTATGGDITVQDGTFLVVRLA